MAAEQFGIAFLRALPDLTSPLVAGTADRNPVLDPLAERYLVRRDVFNFISGRQQFAQLLLRVFFCAAERLCELCGANPIAQQPNIVATLPERTLSIFTFCHRRSPLSLIRNAPSHA